MEYLVCRLIEHISQNMAGLSVVDEDYGQLEALDNDNIDMYPLTFPAVLIETPETDWGDISDGGQKGTCTVRVRLVIDCYDDTHATSGTVEAVSSRDDMRHELHAILQGFRPCGDGVLMRTKSKFFTWNHGIKVYETTYTTTVSEYTDGEKQAVRKPKVVLSVNCGNR